MTKGRMVEPSGFAELGLSLLSGINILSEDLEYPPCPECENNPGLLTRRCQNSKKFRCLKCGHEFGNVDDITTSRNLPRPIRDDFAACIIGPIEPEDQADIRGVSPEDVVDNLRKADELLPFPWFEEQIRLAEAGEGD